MFNILIIIFMKKRNLFMLPCIAAVAIATYVEKKTFETNACKYKSLLILNVEALSTQESTPKEYTCYSTITEKDGCLVRYCQTCTYVPGTDTWYAPSHKCKK